MRILTTTIVLAAAAASATIAYAQPGGRLNDAEFIRASRCMAISSATGGDAAGVDAKLKAQSRGRDNIVLDRAATVRRNAEREARRADDIGKQRMIAERDGACQVLLG